MSSLEIRRLRREDVDDVWALEKMAFPEPWTRAMIASELTAPQRDLTVARLDDGTLAGYLLAMYIFEETHVNKIAVAPPVRRMSVARRLMGHLIDRARERGGSAVSLEVRRSNLPAISFYLGLGFQTIHTRRNYYPDGEDALVMDLEL